MPIKCRGAEKEQEAASPAGEEELKPNCSALIKLGEDSRSDSSAKLDSSCNIAPAECGGAPNEKLTNWVYYSSSHRCIVVVVVMPPRPG